MLPMLHLITYMVVRLHEKKTIMKIGFARNRDYISLTLKHSLLQK
jgi:hypothetical protein